MASLNRGSRYTAQHYIYIESGTSPLGSPDTFDRDIIIHEYGHRLEAVFSFFNQGADTLHTWCDASTTWEAGASEGFSNWFACIVPSRTRIYDSRSSFADTIWWDVENGQTGNRFGLIGCGSANNNGLSCEGAVAGILWDISDSQKDDFSTIGVFHLPFNDSTPDGIGDSISDLRSSILAALLDRSYSGHRPYKMWDLWAAWHNSPTLGHTKGLRDVYYEHGDDIFVSCCNGVRGDVNMSGVVDLTDLTCLVSYMQGYGYVLPCPTEANLDRAGTVDLTDLVALVSYLGGGGYVLLPCSP